LILALRGKACKILGS